MLCSIVQFTLTKTIRLIFDRRVNKCVKKMTWKSYKEIKNFSLLTMTLTLWFLKQTGLVESSFKTVKVSVSKLQQSEYVHFTVLRYLKIIHSSRSNQGDRNVPVCLKIERNLWYFPNVTILHLFLDPHCTLQTKLTNLKVECLNISPANNGRVSPTSKGVV